MLKSILKTLQTFAVSLLFIPQADARIINADKFDQVAQILETAGPTTLIILDVGNVLLRPSDSIRMSKNRSQYNKFIDDMRKKFGNKKAEELESIIWRDGKLIPVSFQFSKAIKDAEAKGARVLVVTDRWNGSYGVIPSLEKDLILKIKQLGYNFKSDWLERNNFRLGDKKAPCQPLFKDFIILTCDQHKGNVLKEFLDVVKYRPSHIIFIDDNAEHIKEISEVLNDIGVRNFDGIRYTEANKSNVFDLDQKAVNLQFSILAKDRKWISEDEAKELLKR